LNPETSIKGASPKREFFYQIAPEPVQKKYLFHLYLISVIWNVIQDLLKTQGNLGTFLFHFFLMRKLIVLIPLFYLSIAEAQPFAADTLLTQLQNEKQDTSRVILLAKLSRAFLY